MKQLYLQHILEGDIEKLSKFKLSILSNETTSSSEVHRCWVGGISFPRSD